MQERSTSNLTQDEILGPLFVCKVTRDKVSQTALLAEYKHALRDLPRQAIIAVIDKIRLGELCSDSPFCPLPPDLRLLVQNEFRVRRLLSEPRLLPPPPIEKSSMQILMEKRWAGQTVIMENVGLDEAKRIAKQGGVPPGSIYVAILQRFYARPSHGFYGERKDPGQGSAALQRFRQQQEAEKRSGYVAQPIQTEEQRAYWAKIASFKDAPNITSEQAQFRGNVEQQLEG